jgi:transcriptional regulator with XRE-family HTH domain
MNPKRIVEMILENHKTFAAGARVTGLSHAYLSRISSGADVPAGITDKTYQKLLRGLSRSQIESLDKTEAARKIHRNEQVGMFIAALDPRAKNVVMDLLRLLGYVDPK